jgi:hypothetical protein
MTIYIVVLYVCVELRCEFLQSETRSYDKQVCEIEITQQIERGKREGLKIDGVCIDVDLGKNT